MILVCILIVEICYSQKSQRTTLLKLETNPKVSLKGFVLEVMIKDSADRSYQSFKSFKINETLDFVLPSTEPYFTTLRLKKNDSLYAESGSIIVYDKQIKININLEKRWINYSSKQNDFKDENIYFLFDLPAILYIDKNWSLDLFRKSYEITIPKGISVSNLNLIMRQKKYENIVLKELNEYKNYYYATRCFYSNANNFSLKTLDSAYNIIAPKFGNSYFGKKLKEYIDQAKMSIIDKKIISFTIENELGTSTISDSIFSKTKYTLIDFWASWCGPCREQMQLFKELYKKLDTTLFNIVSVSIDDAKKKWLTALKQEQLPWKNFLAAGGYKGDVAKAFNINFIPRNILVDNRGIIIANYLDDEKLESFLTEKALIKE